MLLHFNILFLVVLWNARYLGPLAKLLYFETQIATFVRIPKKLPLVLFTESAAFPGKSTNLSLLL